MNSTGVHISENIQKKLHHPCGMLDRDQRTTISIQRKVRNSNFKFKMSSSANRCLCQANEQTLMSANQNANCNIKNCIYSDLNNNNHHIYNNNQKNLKKCSERNNSKSPLSLKGARNTQFKYIKWALNSHNFLLVCICLLTLITHKSNAAPHLATSQSHKGHKMSPIKESCLNDIVPRLEKIYNFTSKTYSFFNACYNHFLINEYKQRPLEEENLRLHKPEGYPEHMLKLHNLYISGKGLDQVLGHLNTSGPIKSEELIKEIDTLYAYFKTVNYLIKNHIKFRQENPSDFNFEMVHNGTCNSTNLWRAHILNSDGMITVLERFHSECMNNSDFSVPIGHNANVDRMSDYLHPWKVYTEQTKIYCYAANSLKRLYSRLKNMQKY